MHFSSEMLEAAKELEDLGHKPILSNFIESFSDNSDNKKEEIKLKQKFEEDAMRRDWESMKQADALLVINHKRHGIENYIGGNTLFELAAGYFAGKTIYLLNPIPEIEFYKTEIEAVKPIILNGDLSKIG